MSRYLDMVRGQRPRRREIFTAKSVLSILAVVAMCGSAIYWWGVQSELTDNMMMALAFTAILVLAPPVLTSFLIPWSPGGMLLQKINAKTWGYGVIIACALFLLYYSFEIQYSWWETQYTVRETHLVLQQVIVGIIGFIIIPALLWTPVNSEELVEQVRQAHLVKRYELQTQADIAIMRSTLLRAQEKALIGFANLTAEEKEELSEVMRGLVKGIDRTLKDIGQSVKTVSGATLPFSSLEDNDEIKRYLDYIHDSLTHNALPQLDPSSAETLDYSDASYEVVDEPPRRAPQGNAAPHTNTNEALVRRLLEEQDRLRAQQQYLDDDYEEPPEHYRRERPQTPPRNRTGNGDTRRPAESPKRYRSY